MQSIHAWQSLEKSLGSLGLAWAFHRLPEHLQVARSSDFALGIEYDHLLPDDYRAFVSALGYPVVGFSYYCRIGLSFLTPRHVESLSPMVASSDGEALLPAPTTRPRANVAFFAGTDLSDLTGWGFAHEPGSDRPVVWAIDGSLVGVAGPFDAWAASQAARIAAWARSLTKAQRLTLEQENEGQNDPHRALDYALDLEVPHERATAADRALHWVCDESKSPYHYGVIDDEGTWRLAPPQPFDAVGPFIRGTARVRREGHIVRIDPTGHVVEDLTPAPVAPKSPTLDLTGKRVTLVGSFRVPGVSLGDFERRIVALGGTFGPVTEPADIYAMSPVNHFPENEAAARAQQERILSTQLVPLATFVTQLGL